MRFSLFFFLLIADSVFALGDPNFIPATPPDGRVAPPVDSMIDTTETVNQVKRPPAEQKQEPEDEELLDHRYDEPEKKKKEAP